MRDRLARPRAPGGNFVGIGLIVVGLVLVAVVPFALAGLRVQDGIEHRLAPAQTDARALLSLALDEDAAARASADASARADRAPVAAARADIAVLERRLRKLHLPTKERAA